MEDISNYENLKSDAQKFYKIGDNGNMHFWSIVPDWTTNKYRDAKFVSTMKGNPEED